MKKSIYLIILIMLAVFPAVIPLVSAHCPLCTAGAAAGVGVARYYGVDDSIVGLFIGAFIISSALWFNKWLKKKKFMIPAAIVVLFSFLVFAVPFYTTGLITHVETVKAMPQNYSVLGFGALGIDKLFSGMIVGSFLVWGAFGLSDYIRNKRGKVLWPYQGISFMIITLAVLTLVFWLLTK